MSNLNEMLMSTNKGLSDDIRHALESAIRSNDLAHVHPETRNHLLTVCNYVLSFLSGRPNSPLILTNLNQLVGYSTTTDNAKAAEITVNYFTSRTPDGNRQQDMQILYSHVLSFYNKLDGLIVSRDVVEVAAVVMIESLHGIGFSSIGIERECYHVKQLFAELIAAIVVVMRQVFPGLHVGTLVKVFVQVLATEKGTTTMANARNFVMLFSSYLSEWEIKKNTKFQITQLTTLAGLKEHSNGILTCLTQAFDLNKYVPQIQRAHELLQHTDSTDNTKGIIQKLVECVEQNPQVLKSESEHRLFESVKGALLHVSNTPIELPR